MSSENPTPPVTAKSALDTLKEWKELIAFVALTLTSALNGIFGSNHPTLQKASWILAVVFVAVGAYVIHRKQKRKREQERRERLWAEREAKRKPQSAFRSLAPFEERDDLPGRDRKIEARSIATRIADNGFRFGVVCGDSGCGKTSLLRSEVTRALKEGWGFEVSHVHNPRQLESKSAEGLPAADRLTRELRALSRHVTSTTQILILDQFEEWFIEYQDSGLRKQIGQAIKKLAERPQPVRVVCAIRRDFLIDFHDLADVLPQPLSTTNLFHVKNFTVDQTVDVITDCATAEGVALDDSFAKTVAHDLSDRDQVRPPELQIVCTYLARGGGLSTSKYQEAGGTAGVLAHYIEDALAVTSDRGVASRLVRALCDFPAHAKQKGKTIDELTAEVGANGVNARQTVEEIARNFVLARILSQEKGASGDVFSLIHDYLVGAIQLATSDDSTKTEEANQLLRFYLAEKRGTIPFYKLRFIRKFAERKELNQQPARALVRKSMLVTGLWWGVPVLVALAIVGGYLKVTAQMTWNQGEVLGQHRVDGDHDQVSIGKISGARLASLTKKSLRIWNSKSGALIASFARPATDRIELLESNLSGRYITIAGAFRDEGEGMAVDHSLTLIDLDDNSTSTLSGDASLGTFNFSENYLIWNEPPNKTPSQVVVYDVKQQKRLLTRDRVRTFDASTGANRFVTSEVEDNAEVARLFELSSGKPIADLAKDDGKSFLIVRIIPATKEIWAMYETTSNKLMITAWGYDGSPLRSEELLGLKGNRFFLTRTTNHLVLLNNDGTLGEIIDVKSLEQITTPQDARYDTDEPQKLQQLVPYWPTPEGIAILDDLVAGARVVPGLHVGKDDYLILNSNGERALHWSKASIELWNLRDAKLLWTIPHSGAQTTAGFTLEDQAVQLFEEPNLSSFYDAVDGEPLGLPGSVVGTQELYYDRDCQRVTLWDSTGQVKRFTRGRTYFGWFRAANLGWFRFRNPKCA